MSPILPSCVVFALLLTISSVNTLTCYKCDTNGSGLCGWGIASFTYATEQCDGGLLGAIISPQCYKIKAQNKEGKEYIARGCLPSGVVGCSAIANAIGWIGAQSNEPDGLRDMSCDTCSTDKCNSAQKITGLTLAAMIVSSVVLFF